VLGQCLVHAAHAGRHAGAGVGDVEDLEQLLDRAVLATGPVQGDEGGVGALSDQPLDKVGADVERQWLVPQAIQCVLDARPRAQRDAPFE